MKSYYQFKFFRKDSAYINIDIIDYNGLKGCLKGFEKDLIKKIEYKYYNLAKKLGRTIISRMEKTNVDKTKSYWTGSFEHHPSLPGNPPAIDSGHYFKNIGYEKVTGGGRTYVANVHYAEFLEEGTRLMKARPVWWEEIDKIDIKRETEEIVIKYM